MCKELVVYFVTSLVAQLLKKPPAMRETWVRSLGWEDPLQKGKATHSSILVCRIPWTVWSMELHPEVRPEGREPLPDKAGESTLPFRSGGEKGLRGGGAGKPQGSSRGRPGFRGTLWVASRVPSALSTSNS